ncbi:MAG: Uma2 family endonuclease, partial [Blastocatellia bacterium]
MSTQIEPLLTVADIETMPEDGNRYEVIEGEIFVSKAPSLTHQRVSARLTASFEIFLEETSIGVIWPGPGVIFSEISGVIPDIVYVSNERLSEVASGERITGAPDLVIEIVSPGADNEQRDRVAKRQLYAKYGVKEYWLVYLSRRNVEVYVLRKNSLALHVTCGEGDLLVSSLLPGFS